MSEEASGAISGFFQGGLVGAIGGYASGRKKRKARRALRQAQIREGYMKDLIAARQRRDIVQNAYVARSEMAARAMANPEEGVSSGIRGANTSLRTQMREQLGTFDLLVEYQREADKFYARAGKYQRQAGQIGQITDAIVSAGQAGMLGGFGGMATSFGGSMGAMQTAIGRFNAMGGNTSAAASGMSSSQINAGLQSNPYTWP